MALLLAATFCAGIPSKHCGQPSSLESQAHSNVRFGRLGSNRRGYLYCISEKHSRFPWHPCNPPRSGRSLLVKMALGISRCGSEDGRKEIRQSSEAVVR